MKTSESAHSSRIPLPLPLNHLHQPLCYAAGSDKTPLGSQGLGRPDGSELTGEYRWRTPGAGMREGDASVTGGACMTWIQKAGNSSLRFWCSSNADKEQCRHPLLPFFISFTFLLSVFETSFSACHSIIQYLLSTYALRSVPSIDVFRGEPACSRTTVLTLTKGKPWTISRCLSGTQPHMQHPVPPQQSSEAVIIRNWAQRV